MSDEVNRNSQTGKHTMNTFPTLYHRNKDGKCFFCGEQTNSLGGNPSEWALRLPVDPNEPGRLKTVCTGCVLERLRIAEEHLREDHGSL